MSEAAPARISREDRLDAARSPALRRLKLGAPQLAVLSWLIGEFLNGKSLSAWPSVETLMERTGLSDRGVRLALKKIEAAGVMRIESRGRPGGGRGTNVYIFREDDVLGWAEEFRRTSSVDSKAAPDAALLPSKPEPPAGLGVGKPASPAGSNRHPLPIEPAPGAGEKEPGRKNQVQEPERQGAPAPTQDGFAEWWRSYPLKQGKDDAQRAWKAMKPADRERAPERLLDYLDRRAAAERTGAFVPQLPHASTWLRRRRWEDEFKADDCGSAKPHADDIKAYGEQAARSMDLREGEVF